MPNPDTSERVIPSIPDPEQGQNGFGLGEFVFLFGPIISGLAVAVLGLITEKPSMTILGVGIGAAGIFWPLAAMDS